MTEVYYKVRQVLQSVTSFLQSASGITKRDRLLLQSASGITKCDSYYKVRSNTCSFTVLKQFDLLSNTLQNVKKVEMCSMLSNTSYLFLS